VIKKFGLSPAEFDVIMSAPPRRFEDFPSYAKLRTKPLFVVMLRLYQVAKLGVFRRARQESA
jgi:hypothetical protein